MHTVHHTIMPHMQPIFASSTSRSHGYVQLQGSGTCSRRKASRRNRCCALASMLDSQAGNLNCGGGGSPAAARASSKRLTSCSRCSSVSAADHHGSVGDWMQFHVSCSNWVSLPLHAPVACSQPLQCRGGAPQANRSSRQMGVLQAWHPDLAAASGRRWSTPATRASGRCPAPPHPAAGPTAAVSSPPAAASDGESSQQVENKG